MSLDKFTKEYEELFKRVEEAKAFLNSAEGRKKLLTDELADLQGKIDNSKTKATDIINAAIAEVDVLKSNFQKSKLQETKRLTDKENSLILREKDVYEKERIVNTLNSKAIELKLNSEKELNKAEEIKENNIKFSAELKNRETMLDQREIVLNNRDSALDKKEKELNIFSESLEKTSKELNEINLENHKLLNEIDKNNNSLEKKVKEAEDKMVQSNEIGIKLEKKIDSINVQDKLFNDKKKSLQDKENNLESQQRELAFERAKLITKEKELESREKELAFERAKFNAEKSGKKSISK